MSVMYAILEDLLGLLTFKDGNSDAVYDDA